MTVTTNDFNSGNSPVGNESSSFGFAVGTLHTSNYLEDPRETGKGICTRGVLVEVAGDLEVEYPNGQVHIIEGLAAGVIHPLKIVRVDTTNTTATGVHVWV